MPQFEADVCVITTIHAPNDPRIYDRGILTLLDAGYAVGVIAPWPATTAKVAFWRELPYPRSRHSRLLHGFRTFVKALGTRSRSYHFHDPDFLLFAVALKTVRRVPVIYDCHENNPEDILSLKLWIPRSIRRPLAAAVRFLENRISSILGYVITVSPELAQRFSATGAEVAVVRNITARQPHPDLRHKRAVIYTGPLVPGYGADTLLEAARELKRRGSSLTIVAVDRFPEALYERSFRTAIQVESLPIVVTPRVDPSEIASLLCQGHIGVSPDPDTDSMRRGFHGKLLEYLAYGLPIVATDVGGNREIVTRSGAGILVPAGDAFAFVSAVLSLDDDTELHNRMRQQGFAALRSIYSWHHERQKLLDFYERVVRARTTSS